MRVVSTRVLPEPAPAKMSACVCGKVTAAACSLLRPWSKGEVPFMAAEDEAKASGPEEVCIEEL
jgi:hypothetical protein